jgi:hypothetical protein
MPLADIDSHFVVGGTLATHGYPVPEGVDG